MHKVEMLTPSSRGVYTAAYIDNGIVHFYCQELLSQSQRLIHLTLFLACAFLLPTLCLGITPPSASPAHSHHETPSKQAEGRGKGWKGGGRAGWGSATSLVEWGHRRLTRLEIGRALGTVSDLQPGGRGRGQLLREVG